MPILRLCTKSHWPNCNWCGKGGNDHLANPGNDTNEDPDSDPDASTSNSDLYPDGGDMDYSDSSQEMITDDVMLMPAIPLRAMDYMALISPDNFTDIDDKVMLRNLAVGRGMRKIRRTYSLTGNEEDKEFDASASSQKESWTAPSKKSWSQSSETWKKTWTESGITYYAESDWSDARETVVSTNTWSGHIVEDSDVRQITSVSTSPSRLGSPTSLASSDTLAPTAILAAGFGGAPSLPSGPLVETVPLSSTSSENVLTGTPTPAQAPARTGKPDKPSCTPSPTSRLAPSASKSLVFRPVSALLTYYGLAEAWTTCPYVARDGQVNPDVRYLNGPDAINSASQSILYNAVAYAFNKTASYSSTATSFIDTFFLDPSTKMNPNMNFGQLVRGPGQAGQQGTFTGVLDLRGIVKIINGILVLKSASSPDWTPVRDKELADWMSQYAGWLQQSPLGKMSASRPK